MTPDPRGALAALAEKSAAHQAYLDRNTKYLCVNDLAARWGCAHNTVRAVPRGLLPYLNIGTGLQREARRYHPDDVFAYEAQRNAA